MNSLKKLSVVALLFATVYAGPTVRERLGQAKENKLAQVQAKVEAQDCGCGCPCDVDYPTIPSEDLPNLGSVGSVALADNNVHVDYNVGTSYIPTTTTQTRSAAESCAKTSNNGKQGSCGVRLRHFDIDGSVCVSEWVESCEFDCGWEKSSGCSAKAQTCVSGLSEDSDVDLGDAQPECLQLSVTPAACNCDDTTDGDA